MKPRCLILPSAFLALTYLVLPLAADSPPPVHLRSDILYTHRGEFIQVSPMRPLTLNARVEQFAYDPLGLEIAVVGSETQGDETVHYIKTVDARTGHELSRIAVTALAEDLNTGLLLLGWSVSGKYLLMLRLTSDPQNPNASNTEYLRWDLTNSPPTARKIVPEMLLPPEALRPEGTPDGFASPDNHWIAFRQTFQAPGTDGKPLPSQDAYLLYDVEKDTFRPLTLPPGVSSYSWSDSHDLAFREGKVRKQFDVITGRVSVAAIPPDTSAPAVSKQYPDLTLDTQNPKQQDTQGSDGHLDSYLIWIRRTPFGKFPLGTAAAGLMPNSNDGSLTAGNNDPQAVWSPTGKQVAFIANNDLYVTDLTAAAELLPNEKMAVGLKLSCADEQALAQSDLKQIGLGIIQFTQDNDENLPASDGWIKTIYPYIKSMEVFQVDGHSAVYEQPADLALAKMESPATTEEAYMDLPCARVVLFADGHVKSFPKQETAP